MSYCLVMKQGNWGCRLETEHTPRMVKALGSIPIPMGKQGFVGSEAQSSYFLGFSHIGSARQT